jgi:hypothetical protein
MDHPELENMDLPDSGTFCRNLRAELDALNDLVVARALDTSKRVLMMKMMKSQTVPSAPLRIHTCPQPCAHHPDNDDAAHLLSISIRAPTRGHDLQLQLLRQRPHRHLARFSRAPTRGHDLQLHLLRQRRRRSRQREAMDFTNNANYYHSDDTTDLFSSPGTLHAHPKDVP